MLENYSYIKLYLAVLPRKPRNHQHSAKQEMNILAYIFEPIGLTQFIVFTSKCNFGKECDFSFA